MNSLAPLPSDRPRRLVYLGTPEIAVGPLYALVHGGFDVVLAITRADKRRGRGGDVAPSPVKSAARDLSIPVSHRVSDALDVGADVGVVVAFGQLINAAVLERLPMVNLHFSLLPRWRGAAPVERALLAGDTVTGVSLMQLDVGLDTGPVLDVVEVPIGSRQTAAELRCELADVGARMLVHQLAGGLGRPTAQTGEPTVAAKLDQADFEIDWSRPASEIDRLIRLGVAWTTFRGRRLKILAAEPVDPVESAEAVGPGDHGVPGAVELAVASAPGTFCGTLVVRCGAGSIRLRTVQPESRPAMDATSWSNGAKPLRGERIGNQT